MRGGTLWQGAALLARWGLSPLARGNRLFGYPLAVEGGSIPACAGEPKALLQRLPASRVYPRLRGGTGGSLFWPLSVWGLSPLARGNRPKLAERPARAGSIPACAGDPRPR